MKPVEPTDPAEHWDVTGLGAGPGPLDPMARRGPGVPADPMDPADPTQLGEAPITQTERTVLRAIDAFLDTKPPRYPHTSDLIGATGLTEDSVNEAVLSLERLDYIVVEPVKLGGTGEITHITRTGQHHL
ncbi:hypothetical protein [Streptomyces sp. NPDC051776]|uniref:hypothetical protein n=1 Tax=Streptomyces sp. NPDC051776 TaxID=3155414 RepID=UPI0034132318